MMKKNKKWLMMLVISAFSYGPIYAQEQSFDLDAQRSESQDILKVPGNLVDHKGLIINPTPQQMKVSLQESINISNGVVLKDKKNAFAMDFNFIKLVKKGMPLNIDFGEKIAIKKGLKKISGAYALEINDKGISIVGYDEKGAYYGIQTLRQIAESPIASQGAFPYIQINDYPSMKYRGIVEGFYGTPWSHEVRLSLIDFLGKFKLNSYLYGPKDDPYHSSPNWRLPYPTKEAQNIQELVQNCNRNRVDFVWAIHPGKDIKWNEEDFKNLVNKFEMMYSLGVRSFAIFFDDIEGEGTNPVKQAELLNRLNIEFVKAKGDVPSLVMCPTDYSKLWANPTPQGSLAKFGNMLDSSIDIFWTGDVVCSDLTKETMNWINSRIKRPAYYWWNYPVTDYARHIMMQGPVYGLDTTLTENDIVGLVSNPMEHGEASKLALYSVADYTWNIANYNPMDSWERGLENIAANAKIPYRTFAIHSTDTETGYRRSESWETQTFRISDYTQAQFDSLFNEFEKVEKIPMQIENQLQNKILLNELRPWLVEFGKIGTRGKKALELINLSKSNNEADFWTAYVQNLMTEEQRQAYNTHKSGTMKLQPFYENTMDDLAFNFYTKLTGEIPFVYKGIGSFNNIYTILSKAMFDNDSTTHYTSGQSQYTGSWIGADLQNARDITEINILQGRNSINDVDYFDNAILEYSLDGKNWLPLIDNLKQQYIIKWNSSTPITARYVRIRKLQSNKTNWAAVRMFQINPVHIETLGFVVDTTNAGKAMFAFDKNPLTSFFTNGQFSFGIPKNAKECTMLLKQNDTPIKMKQLASNGAIISETEINSPFFKFNIEKNVVKIQIDGNIEIFEIIFQ